MSESFSAEGSLVQMPCGPRKSGMPDSVEIPAPVSTTICRAPRSRSARRSRGSTSAMAQRYARARATRPGDRGRAARPRARVGGEAAPRDLVTGGSRRDSLRVVEGLAVTLVGPLRALLTERGVEADRVQRALDVVGVVALFEQGERDPAGTPTRLGE